MEHDHRGISRARRTATCLLPWTETPSDLSGWCQPRDREGEWTCPWHWFTWFCRKWFSMVNSWVHNVRIFWGSLLKNLRWERPPKSQSGTPHESCAAGFVLGGRLGLFENTAPRESIAIIVHHFFDQQLWFEAFSWFLDEFANLRRPGFLHQAGRGWAITRPRFGRIFYSRGSQAQWYALPTT